MTRARAFIALLITLSLVAVPASVGASAAGMSSIATSGASECNVPCPMADHADMTAAMPISGGCNGMDGKSAPITPSACAAFCSGFVALPAAPVVLILKVADALPSPHIEAFLTGRADPPEPYPPRS
jgi:hypothetical protein